MLKNKTTKKIFYEVNPLFFFDSNNDGFGDFAGLTKKIDYFKFIEIDCLIFPDIFNNYNILLFKEYIDSKSKYGNIDDLKVMITTFKEKKIDIAIEINLKDIYKSLLFSTKNKDLEYQFYESKKSFFLDKKNDLNIDQEKNWNSLKTINAFKKIINFWSGLGVNNFIFVNFENLFNNSQNLDNISLQQIRELYRIVNSQNNNSTIILKSALLPQKTINLCLDEKNPCADFFINNSYSLIGTNPKTKNDKFETFKPYKLIKKIREANVSNVATKKNIIALDSYLSGRINSRWGHEGVFNSLASKALITVAIAHSGSSVIYYGDELGMLKIDIKNQEDFHDIYATERRLLLESQGIKKIDFLKAQQYLSPINTQSLFQWDHHKNGGFSTADVAFRPLSSTYKEINVLKQFNDHTSSLNYFKKIIELTKNPIYANFFNNGKFKIYWFSKDVLKYVYSLQNKKLYIFINLSKKWKRTIISSKLNVVFSNYSDKKYENKIKILAPFETIVLFDEKL